MRFCLVIEHSGNAGSKPFRACTDAVARRFQQAVADNIRLRFALPVVQAFLDVF